MSRHRPPSRESDSQKRITDVIDYTNIDDFFNQPSPHELTATSEHRVHEMTEDLKRQTVEEMKNWSWRPSDDDNFKAFKFFNDFTEKTSVIPNRDIVSSPASLPTVTSSSTESNCAAAVPIDPRIQSFPEPSPHTYARSGTSSSSPQNELPRASYERHKSIQPLNKLYSTRDLDNTSSRLRNVKGRAKIPPPIPIIARDFAYQCPRTPLEDPRTPPLPPPVTPATPSAALQQIAQLEQMLTTEIPPGSALSSVIDQQSLAVPVRDQNTRETVMSLPLAHARASSVAPLGIKRKPLPADSPLLTSLGTHPAFAKTAPGPGRDGLWMGGDGRS